MWQLAKEAEECADHEEDVGQQGAGRQGTGGQEGGHESDCECGRRPAGRLEERQDMPRSQEGWSNP